MVTVRPRATFAHLLLRYRRSAGLTQEQLAELAHLSVRGISNLERGVRRLPQRSTVILLADALGLSATERAAFEAAARALGGQPPAWPRGSYLGAAPDGALVAREAEYERIEGALAAVLAGEGRLLLLTGEPGVGKTRLAQEAALSAVKRGLRVLVGRCYEQYVAAPYSPFAQSLAMALDVAAPRLRGAAEARFADLVRVVPGAFPSTLKAEDIDGGLQTHRAVSGFLRALAADGPVALLLDDLHWADGASLELLGYLARDLRDTALLFLGTYRDTEAGREHALSVLVATLSRERLVERVTLRGLAPEGTAQLIRARLGESRVSDELCNLVHARTDGNPFFTEELLTSLVEQGMIDREGQERRAVEEIAAPESVRAAVRERVGRLGPGAHETLALASVLGQAFELDTLLSAAERPDEEVLDHLEAALGARLLEERQEGRGERYAFAHSLIGQALYEEIPRFRLRRLHLRAAEALEQARGAQVADEVVELARHFQAAGDLRRGARYALVAGDHAMTVYAHAEAARHYRAAVEALEALEERGAQVDTAGAQIRLGEALIEMNHLSDAASPLEEALATYERQGDQRGRARAHAALGMLRSRKEDPAGAEEHFGAALAFWPTGHQPATLARVVLRAVAVKVRTGQVEAAAALAKRGMALAEELADPALQAEALVSAALVEWARPGGYERNVTLLRQAEPVARRANALHALWRARHNLAVAEVEAGDLHEAAADYRRAIAAGEQADEPGQVAYTCVCLAFALLNLGAWNDGRAAARRAADLGVVYACEKDLRHWMAGEPEQALAALREWLVTARRQDFIQQLVWDGGRFADWRLQVGCVDEAETAARQAMTLARQHNYWASVGLALGPLAEAAVRARAGDAQERLEEAETLVARQGHHLAMIQVLRARGLLLAEQGRMEIALATLATSAQNARERHALVELARTLQAKAEIARAAGERTIATQADAERIAVVTSIGRETHRLVWAQGVW
jgi:transcriptional regulator with XRE-family HTH domain